MRSKILTLYFAITAILLFTLTIPGVAQYHYQGKPVLNIISDIEQQTDYRFLYRDALLANRTLSFKSNKESLFSDFKQALANLELGLKVDHDRKQAIIYRRSKDTPQHKTIMLQGQVVDAVTGERLPFATIRWKNKGTTKGTSTNNSGSFSVERNFTANKTEITCSYVGYKNETIVLDFSEISGMHELTFRLSPKRIDSNHLLVTGQSYYSNLSQQAATAVDIGMFNPLGESNSIRAMQGLPSVSLSTAMNNGLHIRGSNSDGFRVLIDGITIYNQSHLFGLIDSFNSDVLKRSGFFYDIAPAHLQAPPGGTLSLVTKTGSLDKLSISGGISNSAGRLTLQSPIQKGRSSWVLSGRKSFMNNIHWLQNDELVQWGLNVNRDHNVLQQGLVDLQSQLVRPGQTNASFFDLHGKLYFEAEDGDQLILSGYWGGDNAEQQAERLFRTITSSTASNFTYQPVETTNEWYNGAASAQYQQWFGDNIYSTTTLGTSIYQTSFKKDDFTYTRVGGQTNTPQSFIFLFKNKSVLNKFKIEQHFELNSQPWFWTAGINYNYYLGEYFESSFDRSGYFSSQTSNQIDAYAQLDYSGIEELKVFGGARLHYYSNGRYLQWSPRLKVTLFPDSKLSFSSGFSRNHQFLSQIQISNTVTSDVWLLATKQQSPTSVNYFSSGIYFSASEHLYAQAEAYYKDFENIRLHEINTYSLSNTFNKNPWFINNEGTAKGIEFLLRTTISPVTLTQTFTVSEVSLSNPSINNGDPFHAAWDRPYNYNATIKATPLSNLSIYLSWMYASGTPNNLATFSNQKDKRLGHYQRTDIAAEFSVEFSEATINITASIFNLTDQNNPWYRESVLAIDQNSTPNQFRSTATDVYDFGFQPAFNISLEF